MEIDDIPTEFFKDIFPNGFTLRDEANAIAAYAIRNGPIEELHAGKRSKLLLDKELSRITQEEMKTIMISASQKIEMLLRMKEQDPEKYHKIIMGYNYFYCNGWER